ncbi:MAG TPA: hypothetical protein VGD78_00820 [Chthoniobacterales bacterium]
MHASTCGAPCVLHLTLGGEIEQLVGVLPIEHAMDAPLDNRQLMAQHVQERAIQDRGDVDRSPIGHRHELAPEIEIAVLTGDRLGEIGRKIGGDETRNPNLRRGVEQHALAVNHHFTKAVQRGDDAGGSGAGRAHGRHVCGIDRH